MGTIIFCRILAPPNAPPPPQTLQYLTILRTEKGKGRHYVCRILAPSMPPSHDATILNYLNDRERAGAPIFFIGFWRPQCPSSSPQTPQYLTILMTERGRHYVCRILAPPMPPPTTPRYLTILMTERGAAIIFLQDFDAPPPMPPSSPDVTILNYLDDRERGGGGVPIAISCKK